MTIDLKKYSGMKICAAVSGGRDSMALLHFLAANAGGCGITLCAVNCDHAMRPGSADESAMVRGYCASLGVPVRCYRAGEALSGEEDARRWRLSCYGDAAAFFGADAVATAHHMRDNAETVLFNISRGSGLPGVCGITDSCVRGVRLIRPMRGVSRDEIDRYVEDNGIPYVTDESNLRPDYTRNRIRLEILPALEAAVPGAERAMYRLSNIARETEDYFDALMESRGTVVKIRGGYLIRETPERAVFSRAVVKVMRLFRLKDYTEEHVERLFALQSAAAGKRFSFLGLECLRERDGVSLVRAEDLMDAAAVPFTEALGKDSFAGERLVFSAGADAVADGDRTLSFDADAIPTDAVVRFRAIGDRFRKFGGGEKSLGDFLTDRKVPGRLRGRIPLVASGSDVLIVCGVEISESVKVTEKTKRRLFVSAEDYAGGDTGSKRL